MRPQSSFHNSLAEHIMSYLKTYKVIVKTVHVDFGNFTMKERERLDLSYDLTPFLPYSLNKRRRWEIEESIGVDLLEEVSELEVDVIILERVRNNPYDWPHYYEQTLPEQFRIRAVHRLVSEEEEGKKTYRKTELKSVLGHKYQNFLPQRESDDQPALEERAIVAYNFLSSPRNHLTLFAKKCISRKSHSWPYTSGWKRLRRREAIDEELRYGELERSEEEDEDRIEEFRVSPSKRKEFYNLSEHVTTRSLRKKRCNSWVLVNECG